MVRSLSLFRPITLSLSPINHLLSLRIGSYSPLSQTPSLWRRRPREDEFNRDPETPPRVLVVQPRVRRNAHLKVKLSEALNLANSLEEQRDGFFLVDFWDKQMPPYVVVQNPLASSRKGRADTYFGPGTVENIKCHINSIESEGELDAVFVNAILTGIQQRNLERAWGKPVLDRVGLIIAIFNAHAYTREAKLQAELAALMYQKSRLVRVRGPDGRYTFGALGEAEVVSGRGRGSGGRGSMSGAGETELELQRRRIAERRSRLLTEIEEVRRTRALQRASRRKRGALDGQALATVAVVGYTNAGKSTLVGALSKSDLYSDDRLFATVDPRLRSVTLPSGRKVLLSDTVGFISDLPVQLVEAFHATLEEVVEADLLMHVLDSSAPNLDEQRSTVLQVLKQIGVSEEKIQNMIEVWNKIDVQGDTASNNCLYDTEELETQPFSETDDYCNNNNNDDNQIKKELSDYSDDWLSPSGGPDSEEDQIYTVMGWTTPTENHSEPVEGSENSNPGNENREPHVKTSAVMGVGLQALLELVDEKLESIDEPRKVVHRTEFDRKWRPPRTEEDGVAVEQ